MVLDPNRTYLDLFNGTFDGTPSTNNPAGWTISEEMAHYVQTASIAGADGNTTNTAMFMLDPVNIAGATKATQSTGSGIVAGTSEITIEFDVHDGSGAAWTSGDKKLFVGLDFNNDGVADVNLLNFVDMETLPTTTAGMQNGWRHFEQEFTVDLDANPQWLDAKVITSFFVNDAPSTGARGRSEAYIDNFGISYVACFASGTQIETDSGIESIETLTKGDAIRTLDNGFQTIRWIGSTSVSGAQLATQPNLRPIRIKAGALGQNLPKRDLIVSRQHRIMLRSKIAQRMFGAYEVLIPACKLVEIEGIKIANDLENVTYWHILFDQHEIIFSEGAPTESLFTGPEALKSVPTEASNEIRALFPELCNPDFLPLPARPIPSKGARVTHMVERHAANQAPLLCT